MYRVKNIFYKNAVQWGTRKRKGNNEKRKEALELCGVSKEILVAAYGNIHSSHHCKRRRYGICSIEKIKYTVTQ